MLNLPGLRHLERADDRTSSNWIFTILVERRTDFVRALASRGIPSSVVHQRIDRNRLFGGPRGGMPGMDAFDRQQISLPVHVGLSDDDVETVIAAVRNGW